MEGHPGVNDCNMLAKDLDPGNENRMIDKEMCVLDLKPGTTIGTFWLKKPGILKLDLKDKRKKPIFGKISVEQSSNYIGICIRMM